jgi:hypothetical protein
MSQSSIVYLIMNQQTTSPCVVKSLSLESEASLRPCIRVGPLSDIKNAFVVHE